MSGHTPGPWRWNQGIGEWELVGGDGNRVLFRWTDEAGLRNGLVLGGNLNQADAALIASAPGLLKALSHLVRWHDQISKTDLEMARAAIDKATSHAKP